PNRSRRSMAAPDKRRSRAQRLSEQHLARHLSRRRFQSKSAVARAARRLGETHWLSAGPLRQNRERYDTGEATPRNQPTALAHGLPGRRFSLFVVPQVLTVAFTSRSCRAKSRHLKFVQRFLDCARNDKMRCH